MRVKDDEKQEALFEATVKLVNEIGFVSSSVSKIAKEANVSPATIYVYYKNKEDLLVSTYIAIKLDLSTAESTTWVHVGTAVTGEVNCVVTWKTEKVNDGYRVDSTGDEWKKLYCSWNDYRNVVIVLRLTEVSRYWLRWPERGWRWKITEVIRVKGTLTKYCSSKSHCRTES